MKKEYRVITEDTYVWAESAEEAVDLAREDMGARVHAEETGQVDEVVEAEAEDE